MNRLTANLVLSLDVLTFASRRKILWIYLALGTLLTVMVVAGANIVEVQVEGQTGYRLDMFGGELISPSIMPPEVAKPAQLLALFYMLILWAGASFFGVVLGLLATVNSVGSAFSPGRAELILTRPISRAEVVLARFLGALAFAVVQVGWVCLLAVLLAGVKFGVWLPGFLLAGMAITLKFAVLCSICTLVVVWTRTRTLGLAFTSLVWAASYLINFLRIAVVEAIEKRADATASGQEPAKTFLEGIESQVTWAQALLPQVSHNNELAMLACQQPPEVPYYASDSHMLQTVLLQDAFWIVVPLLLTALVVTRRDH